MEKRGISPIIATVLILLLTITAVAITARFLIPYIESTLQKGTECIEYRDYFKFEESSQFNCYERSGMRLHGVSVRASPSSPDVIEQISGFDLVFVETGSSKRVSVRDGAVVSDIRMLDSSIQAFEIPQPGEWRTYVYDPAGRTYDSVRVSPALKSGRTCEITDSINLVPCKSGIIL